MKVFKVIYKFPWDRWQALCTYNIMYHVPGQCMMIAQRLFCYMKVKAQHIWQVALVRGLMAWRLYSFRTFLLLNYLLFYLSMCQHISAFSILCCLILWAYTNIHDIYTPSSLNQNMIKNTMMSMAHWQSHNYVQKCFQK